MKLELTFKTDHADLYRDEQDNLIIHLAGVDEGELMDAINNFKAAMEAGQKAQELDAQKAAALDKMLSEKVAG